MERHLWHAAGKTAACAILLVSIGFTSQPCFAQYTAGHTVQNDYYQSGTDACTAIQTRPSLQGATMGTIEPPPSLQGATMGTIGPPPCLQGATMGTIGPQGEDATVVVGVNTAGIARVNMLSNLEALLNIVANGVEMITVLWGSLLMIGVLHYMFRERYGFKRCLMSAGVSLSFLLSGLGIVTNLLNCAAFAFDPPWKRKDKIQVKFWMALLTIKVGLSAPEFVNWLVVMARDANLFS